MNPGIKIGPEDGIEKLKKSQAKYCEIWFRLDWEDKYIKLFQYLQKNKINFGLHFWATIDNKYFPDFLCLEPGLAQKTLKLLKKTIDIASKYNAYYVNFHPESYRLAKLDLDNSKIKVVNPKLKINKEKTFNQFLRYLEKINKYAKKKGIIPFLETVPKFMPSDFKNFKKGRLKPQLSEGLETEKFIQLTKKNYPICLDLGHTQAQVVSDNRKKIFNHLYQSAKQMKDQIGLIHVTTNIPPFNGTDSHNGILEKDFEKGALPNKKQLKKILSIFKNKDIWLIPEPPHKEMIENFKELKKIVDKIEAN
ncbi:hypothetical protein COT75_00805 [Candidatus Beckwithbacteria bacterium CG10_big_fil_rev_8_21_14_0_10_34_10]|uniref:Xylose isomerase-like TIM barrel domain-containing protein n=1 Tax=Candidatus Beckwithbacteria bacterium CG10_big_fil_rev_8_21_14_0_10_34_10 TaxID=1974495 RepID=A0A2H0WA73_9BACT|nr:MAG: hypothetical protein COT75_00805 [Candidatus Beckwithbacteria bacterium CG10_big_fil_rev_8_21_14_0_10_34_10]